MHHSDGLHVHKWPVCADRGSSAGTAGDMSSSSGVDRISLPDLLSLPELAFGRFRVSGGMVFCQLPRLLIIAVAIMLYFVRPIFRSWLLREQPVFLSSYCLLCLAGAVPHVTSPFIGGLFVITLWTVMTAGVIKVNRHVFWLTESHQRPKVFGFFPIQLLSLLFISVASLKTCRFFRWSGWGLWRCCSHAPS